MYHDVMDRHDNLLLGLMILTNFYVNCCAWAQLDSYTELREDTETLEATGTYTDSIGLRLHQHACSRSE